MLKLLGVPISDVSGVAATSRELNGDSTSDDTSVSRFPLLVLTAMRSDASVSAGSNELTTCVTCFRASRATVTDGSAIACRSKNVSQTACVNRVDRSRILPLFSLPNPTFPPPPSRDTPRESAPPPPSPPPAQFSLYFWQKRHRFRSVARPRGRVAENSPFLHSPDTPTPGSTFCPIVFRVLSSRAPSSSHQSSPRERNARFPANSPGVANERNSNNLKSAAESPFARKLLTKSSPSCGTRSFRSETPWIEVRCVSFSLFFYQTCATGFPPFFLLRFPEEFFVPRFLRWLLE